MPQACANMYPQNRLVRAWANEHGVARRRVGAGKLTVEPVDVSRQRCPASPARRFRRLCRPKRQVCASFSYFGLKEDEAPSLAAAYEFLAIFRRNSALSKDVSRPLLQVRGR